MTTSRILAQLVAAAALVAMAPTAHALALPQEATGEPTANVDRAETDEDATPPSVIGETDSIWSYLAQKYDTNADGRVTREEYTRDASTFARLDKNADGAVTADEVESERGPRGLPSSMMATMVFMRTFGGGSGGARPSGLSREQVESGTTAFDANADGDISREEFEARAGQRPDFGGRGRDMDRFGALLEAADTDKNELLSREELLAWFDAADTDNDGQLSMDRSRGFRGSEGGGGSGARGPGMRSRQPPGDSGPEAGVGRTAPDFTLQPLHDGEPVTLGDFAGKTPVALIFGSYT